MTAHAKVTGRFWRVVGGGGLLFGWALAAAEGAAPLPAPKVTADMLWNQVAAAPATAAGADAAVEATGPRKVALFVNNRTDPNYNDYLQALEDKVIAGLVGVDFAPVSKDDTVLAAKQFPTDTPEAAGRNALGTQSDRLLADQSTALRLAQSMGADFLLVVNLTALTVTARDLAATGMDGSLLNYNVGVNYRICGGVTGAALDGGTFNLKKSVRFSGPKPEDDPAVVEGMLDEAASKVAAKLAASAAQLREQPLPADVEILIAAAPRDLLGNEISLPDLRVTEDNLVVEAGAPLPVQVAATVEIDGIALGTTPLRLRVAPGVHKLRLSRAGFEEANLTLSAKDGLTLFPAMTLTAEGYQRWEQLRAFLATLDATRELSSAQAEALRGYAQTLRQSGFKVETTEAPTIERKSIYSIE